MVGLSWVVIIVGDVQPLLTPHGVGQGGISRLRLGIEYQLEKPTANEAGSELMHPVRVIHTIKVVARGGIIQDNIIAQGQRCLHGNELGDLELKIVKLQVKEVVQFAHGVEEGDAAWVLVENTIVL